MSVFKEQTLLDIVLDTKIDLTGASALEIHYKKPSGAEGSWTGVQFETTKIKYSLTAGNIDESDEWRMQTAVTISGRTGWGKIIKVDFLERLTEL